MSFRIEALRSDINAVLQQTEYREHTTIEMTPPSAVSHDNPHRFILDEIRDDLLHLDREKVERIIFIVNQHCAKHEPTGELAVLLERVLEVVRNYSEAGTIFTSPHKSSSPVTISHDTTPNCARKLFADLGEYQ